MIHRSTVAALVCLLGLTGPAGAQWSEADLQAEARQIAGACPNLPATPELALALAPADRKRALRCVLAASAAFMTPRLPKKMAEGVTLIAVETRGTRFSHIYRLDQNALSEAERARATDGVRSVICDAGGRTLVALGASYRFVWTGADGRTLAEGLVARC